MYNFRLTKERDEQIELVIEKLESEKEELIAQNKKEVTTKVNEVLADKREVEQELKEFKSKFVELSNAILSVTSSSKLREVCCGLSSQLSIRRCLDKSLSKLLYNESKVWSMSDGSSTAGLIRVEHTP